MARMLPALLTFLALAGFSAPQERIETWTLPAGVYNVALPEFGSNIGAAPHIDLGLGNLVPICVKAEPDAIESGPKIFLFRTPRPLLIGHEQSVTFRLRIGHVHYFLVWPESYAAASQWYFRITRLNNDGTKTVLLSDVIRNNQLRFIYTDPDVDVEFTISLLRYDSTIRRRLWVTVSPDRIYEYNKGKVVPRATWDWPE